VLAKLKAVVGRIWTYVRDDRPFGGKDPPAALFYYSRNRAGAILPAMSVSCRPMHSPGTTTSTRPNAIPRRSLKRPAGAMAAESSSTWRNRDRPIASKAVRRIDVLFEIERAINGQTPEQRLAVRREKSRPLVVDLEIWMRQQRALLSSNNDTAKAINYLLNRWAAFTRFLDDGRACLSNNAAERALRGVAVGRKNWIFAGSDAGGHRAAAVYTLIETCKMNDVDPQAWLADVLARLPDHPANKVVDLLPWKWKATQQPKAAAAA
jgi:transposase